MKFSGRIPGSFTRLVQTIGLESTLALIRVYGGRQLYVPKINRFLRSRRNHKIWDDYTSGRFTMKQMTKKWDMNKNTLHSIIRRYNEDLAEIAASRDENTNNK